MAANTPKTRAQRVGKTNRWKFLDKFRFDRNRDHTRELLVILFFLMLLAVISHVESPLNIVEGQPARRTYKARVNFHYFDETRTKLDRVDAERKVPYVFLSDPNPMESVKTQLVSFLEKLQNTPIAIIPRPEKDEWGISDAQLEFIRQELQKDNMTPQVTKAIQQLLNEYIKRGIMAKEESDKSTSVITIIQSDNTKIHQRLNDVILKEDILHWRYWTVSPQNYLGEHVKDMNFEFRQILHNIIVSKLQPTLSFSLERTNLAQKEARDRIPDRYSRFEKDHIIIYEDDVVTNKHIRMLAAERNEFNSQQGKAVFIRHFLGAFLICLAAATILGWFTLRLEPKIYRSASTLLRFCMVCLGTIVSAKAFALLGIPYYIMPLAFFSIILGIAYTTQFAATTTVILAVPLALVLGMDLPLLITLETGAIAGILLTRRLRRRYIPIMAGLCAGLIQAILCVAFGIFTQTTATLFLGNAGWSLLNGIVVAVLVTTSLPAVEYFFQVVTDLTLLELGDQNHPLLKRLIMEAPGTYHHSLVVANLAESAVEAIGGNALLTRVALYFHDIGKLLHPMYFTENEKNDDPRHSGLSPAMSTLIIISHTKDGIELANQYKLPKVITQFIPEHHGTSLVEFFYHQAVEEKGEENVKKEAFCYPGPRPQSKETGVAMLADSVEAATRSIADPTPSRIEGKVHAVMMNKLMHNQLDECPLTFSDLAKIEDAFIRVLLGIHHKRVPYPEQLKHAGLSNHAESSQSEEREIQLAK